MIQRIIRIFAHGRNEKPDQPLRCACESCSMFSTGNGPFMNPACRANHRLALELAEDIQEPAGYGPIRKPCPDYTYKKRGYVHE